MQVNFSAYIPLIVPPLGYALGKYATDSILGGTILAVAMAANCVLIRSKSLEDDWVSDERRLDFCNRECIWTFKISLIVAAVCVNVFNLSVFKGVEFLGMCLIFCLLLPMYLDSQLSIRKLATLRRYVLHETTLGINYLKNQKCKQIEHKFFLKCSQDIESLLEKIPNCNSDSIKVVGNDLLNKVNLLLKNAGLDSRNCPKRTFMARVDGKLVNAKFIVLG